MTASAAASGAAGGVDAHLGIGGGLVRGVDPGEIEEFAPPCLFEQALGIVGFGHGQRGIDEDLDELAWPDTGASKVTLGSEGRDERGDDDEAGVDHETGHFGGATDVLYPVGIGEPQVLVEAVADVVAVQEIGVAPQLVELALDDVGDGGLSCSREPGEPDEHGTLPLEN